METITLEAKTQKTKALKIKAKIKASQLISVKLVLKLFVIFTLNMAVILVASSAYSQSGWFSQPLPVNGQVQDLKFFDANTGLIAMWQPTVLLRTTNGGYNWNIVLSNQAVGDFEIIDSSTVYARGTGYTSFVFLYRSFNKGLTWDSLPVPGAVTIQGISFINRDTGWVGGSSNGEPYLWKTTNGGINWTVNSTVTGRGKIFFLKYKVNGEYIGWSIEDTEEMYKTTNSGKNWFQITSIGNASMLYFIDENTGWAARSSNVRKTTNGGLNWNTYNLPVFTGLTGKFIAQLSFLNKDTIYGDSGYRMFPNGNTRGIIWISTNGGVNWGFQQPDTSVHKQYHGIHFVNKDTGWSSWIRTNDGGGPIIISGINNLITIKPENFILEQNYPNPFNSSTRINFSISKPSYISLTVYDITGKEVIKIYNNNFFTSGNYFTAIDFGKSKLPSGVYIYNMTAGDMQSGIFFSESKKLVYLK